MTAKAAADGYTILIVSSSHPIAGLLKKGLPYDPNKDFAGVAQLVVYRSLLVTYPGFAGTTVTSIIAIAKSKPGQLNFVSSGNGTGSHLAGELMELPTIAEAGVPGYEFVSWYGVLAPAGTPRALVAKLNQALNEVMRLPDVAERAQAEDMDGLDRTPQQFDDARKAMIGKWEKIIEQTGIEAN